jgi:hypothetical protein
LPDHQAADADNDYGPDGIEADTRKAQIIEYKKDADYQENDAPNTPAASLKQVYQSERNAEYGPEILKDSVGVNNALLVEQKDHAGGSDK